MAIHYVFADEGGNLDFASSGTRYFTLTSVSTDDCGVGAALLDLRRGLARRGTSLPTGFHASEDRQVVRDRVFELLGGFNFRIDATIFEKAKVLPHLRPDDLQFYKTAWLYHARYFLPAVTDPGDEIILVAATIPLRRKAQYVSGALHDVLQDAASGRTLRVASWVASSDPCLQVADYCCWAIHRKWERGDERSYELIKSRIASEFDIFQYGEIKQY